jgi:hypothetical protein
VKFQYFNPMRTCFLIITALIFWGCPDSASTTDTDSPLGELQFTFLQNDQILYFAIDVDNPFNGTPLQTAVVYWSGTDKPDRTPDNNLPIDADELPLNDDGINGDIIKNDDLYSLKEPNDLLTLIHPIDSSHIGNVFVVFQATYGNGSSFMVEDSFSLGNIIPLISSISAPDTIFLPDSGGVKFELVTADVHDADGPEDIRGVGFVSYHVEGDSFLNEGNIINLYDDGSEVIIYEPNFTSGDVDPNDETYSFRIPVFGPGNPDPALQTKTGTFDWIFEAMDMAHTYSDTVIHRIIVQ